MPPPLWVLILLETWFLVAFAAPVVVVITSLTLVDGMCSVRDPLRTFAPSRGYDVITAVAVLVTRTWVAGELARELEERMYTTTKMKWTRRMQFASLVVSVVFAFAVDVMVLTWTFAHSGLCDSDSPTLRDFCSVVDPSSVAAQTIYIANTVMLAAGCGYLKYASKYAS